MDLQSLAGFFGWCTVLNSALMLYSAAWMFLAPDFTYRLQSRFFPLPRETFNVVFYSFLGAFKICVIVFNFTPWLVLRFFLS